MYMLGSIWIIMTDIYCSTTDTAKAYA